MWDRAGGGRLWLALGRLREARALNWPLKDMWDSGRQGCGEWAHFEQKDGHRQPWPLQVLRHSEQAVTPNCRSAGEVGYAGRGWICRYGPEPEHLTSSNGHGDATAEVPSA